MLGKPLSAHRARPRQPQGAGIYDQDTEDNSADDEEQHRWIARFVALRSTRIISNSIELVCLVVNIPVSGLGRVP